MALSQYSGIHVRRRPPARRGSRKKAAKKGGAGNHAGYGFLNHSFQPVAEIPPAIRHHKQVAREYFASLGNLAALYGFTPLDVSADLYPFNVLKSYNHAVEAVQRQDHNLKLIIAQDERRKACLATIKVYDTGMSLYYIPVQPLLRLYNAGRKEEANLLLSVFAYLFQVVCIPYYQGYNDFLECTYTMIEEFLTGDPGGWDADDYSQCMSEVKAAEYWGKRLLRQIRHPYHVRQFEKRIGNCTPVLKQSALWACCEKLWQLYRDYPRQTIYANFRNDFPDIDDEQKIIPEQYLSFVWSNDGWLSEQLVEQVNYSLQEMSVACEPSSLQYFDSWQQAVAHGFPFEQRFFELTDELVYLLNNIV